jgi:hypothetical protein
MKNEAIRAVRLVVVVMATMFFLSFPAYSTPIAFVTPPGELPGGLVEMWRVENLPDGGIRILSPDGHVAGSFSGPMVTGNVAFRSQYNVVNGEATISVAFEDGLGDFFPFMNVASASYETVAAANVGIFGVVKQGGYELFGVEFNDVGFGEVGSGFDPGSIFVQDTATTNTVDLFGFRSTSSGFSIYNGGSRLVAVNGDPPTGGGNVSAPGTASLVATALLCLVLRQRAKKGV